MNLLRIRDLRGKRFGHLLVKHFARRDKSGHTEWCCLCDCGETRRVRGTKLVTGAIVSCGCARRDPGIRAAAMRKVPPEARRAIAALGGIARKGAHGKRPPKCTMTVDQAAMLVECPRDAIIAMARNGQIECRDVGGRLLVAPRDIEALCPGSAKRQKACRAERQG